MIRASLLFMLAAVPAALRAQSIQATTPMMMQNTPPATPPAAVDVVAYVVRNDHPAFATVQAALDFGSLVIVYGKQGPTERYVAITVSFVDGTTQNHLCTVRAKVTAQNWTQVAYISIGSKTVKSINVAPLTMGTPAPVTYAP